MKVDADRKAGYRVIDLGIYVNLDLWVPFVLGCLLVLLLIFACGGGR